MIKKSKQINKGTVKNQTNKADIKKKIVNKNVVWECLCCSLRVVSEVKPEQCPCSNPNYVVNTQYKVGV